jgi:hypothetical protein
MLAKCWLGRQQPGAGQIAADLFNLYFTKQTISGQTALQDFQTIRPLEYRLSYSSVLRAPCSVRSNSPAPQSWQNSTGPSILAKLRRPPNPGKTLPAPQSWQNSAAGSMLGQWARFALGQKNHAVRCRGPEGPVHLVHRYTLMTSCGDGGSLGFLVVYTHSLQST